MKRKFLLAVFIMVLCTVSVLAQNQAIVISKTAQFREQPNKKAKIILTVKKGAKFNLESTDHKNGWYRVSVLGGNVKGWIFGNDIKISKNDLSDLIAEVDKIVPPPKNERNETKEQFTSRLYKTFPDEWVIFGIATDDCYYFYNKNRIIYNANLATLWTRTACFRSASVMSNVPDMNATLVKLGVFYRLDKIKMDCVAQKVGIFHFNFYDQKEIQIGEASESTSPQMFDILPGSVFEQLLIKLCKIK